MEIVTIMNVGQLQVWWIPQIPMKAFEVNVDTVGQAVLLLETLARYDAFQFENRIKPDYSNVGGLRVWVADDGEGKEGWNDWYDEETDCDDPFEYVEQKRV